MSVKISDLQLVETLHWGVEAIGRIYGVPLQYLQYPGGNTSYSSAEVLGQAWLVLGLAPMLARIEAGLQRLIIGETTFIKFNTGALLRATQKERMDSYAVALQNGILTLDEVRQYEDLPKLVSGGDQHWKPLNIGVVGDESTRDEAETAGVLVRAGYDPNDSAKVAGLPPIKHTGAAPVTVQADEAQPIGETIANALRSMPAPVVNIAAEKPRSKVIERDSNGDISRIVEE